MKLPTASVLFIILTIGSVGAAYADTFPISGTANFETGMRRIATITLNRDVGARVNWGDGTTEQIGWLVDCHGFLNQTCDVYGTHRYAVAGSYTISIHYRETGLFPSSITETTTATIRPVGDFVIVSIGDSVASGEGTPVVSQNRVFDDPRETNKGLWDDPGSNYGYGENDFDAGECHRSRIAGPVVSAVSLRSTNPSSNITVIHVACSGAKINAGPVESIVNQLRSVRRRLEAGRLLQGGLPTDPPVNIDALLVSAGANNIAGGFGNVVASCLTPFSDCSTDATLIGSMTSSFNALAGDFLVLANEIATPGAGTRGTVSDVYITEYFDPSRDETGNFPSQARSNTCAAGLIDPSEWEFLYNEMVVPLNDAVAQAAGVHGWHMVDGIAQDFQTHGYCAQPGPFALFGDSWVIKGPESLDQQGDLLGTSHPNALGQGNYHDHIHPTIIEFTPPRTTPTATAGGQPYAFGTWTADSVELTLAATNPISESGVMQTYYAVNNPDCTPAALTNCVTYSGPIAITASGEHTVTFFSTNLFGTFEAVTTVSVRIDKDPPVMTCSATPSALWPPNHKMVSVAASVQAIDAVSGPTPFRLTTTGLTEGNAAADIQGFVLGLPDTLGILRATRLGSGPGRDYSLVYQSSDPLGNTASCTLVIPVPHDQGKRR